MLNFRIFACLCLVLSLSACAGVFGCPDCSCDCPVTGDAIAQGAAEEVPDAPEAEDEAVADGEIATEEDQGEINEAMAHPSVDDLEIVSLKRRKLSVKDEIARLQSAVH